MGTDELMQEVTKITYWHHRMDLGNGVITPSPNDTPGVLPTLHMPASLRGLTVLDIGAWDGFFSFEAERRGASRVLATDWVCWGENPWAVGGFGTKAGFELARRALNSKVEDLKIDLFELSPEKVGTFDLVLFLGVLYHLRHPLLALERVISVTGKQLILETAVDLVGIQRPAMAFYPDKELNEDETNWWGPNPAAVEAMLRSVGFRKTSLVDVTPTAPEETRDLEKVQLCRAVVHAWR